MCGDEFSSRLGEFEWSSLRQIWLSSIKLILFLKVNRLHWELTKNMLGEGGRRNGTRNYNTLYDQRWVTRKKRSLKFQSHLCTGRLLNSKVEVEKLSHLSLMKCIIIQHL